MSWRPCVVIPIYNHKDTIGATLAHPALHDLPLFVVDDGSDGATQRVLDRLAIRYRERMTLVRLPVNGGKGAAVMAGMRTARAAGYTHALQIDADGQHDITDVPRFLELARAAPEAIVLGRPVYDDSVPKGRLYGRYLTHVWVWIETLSFTIEDAMCGYRLYPLAACCELIDQVRLPTRMDFDIEILVRLYWRRLTFLSVPTRVVYAADGLSHFDVFWDNVRISRSHTRLVAGMLCRLPLLLLRKILPRPSSVQAAPAEARWWHIAERGGSLGMALLVWSCRTFGMNFTRLWLHPIVAYFLLTGRQPRQASRDYFARLQTSSPQSATPRPGWMTSYRHMLAFAQSGLDKLAAWSGRVDPGTRQFEVPTLLKELASSGRGALVIGSHLGNLEMMRALATRVPSKKITAVVYLEHARRFNHVLATLNPNFASRLLQVSDFGPETAILMQQRIDAGELLVIVGDRVPATDAGRTVEAEFLGAPARFAQGPYILAHALRCPVYLFFCVKESQGETDAYRFHLEPFAERIELPRRGRAEHIAQWAQRFARRLEHHCRKSPYQWFNFYDFWAGPDGESHDRK